MEPGNGELPQADQATERATIRERISTWLTFAALMVFFIVTIAFWCRSSPDPSNGPPTSPTITGVKDVLIKAVTIERLDA